MENAEHFTAIREGGKRNENELRSGGCAAGPNPAMGTPAVDGNIAGFWLGLWHGMISPITFIVSLFESGVHFYEVHNNGDGAT